MKCDLSSTWSRAKPVARCNKCSQVAKKVAAAGVALAMLAGPLTASATEELVASPAKPKASVLRKPHLRPEWRRVSWPEYALASVLIAAPHVEKALLKPVGSPRWKGPILFDGALHKAVRGSSRAERDFANDLSDNLLLAGIVTNLFIDPILVAGLLHRDPYLAWQMTVINAEVVGLVSLATRMTKRLSARERPYGQDCEVDPSYVSNCTSSARYLSFFSGHTSTSGTLAGLNCAHHLNLSLYGNRMADMAACAGSSALMLMTGTMRLVSSNHWGSDILVGGAIGFATGYLAPSWLYYTAQGGKATESRLLALPMVSRKSIGFALAGAL